MTTASPVAASVPASPPPAPAATDSWSYGALWRRAPRALGYLVPTFIIAIAVSALLNTFLSGAVSLLVFIVGIFALSLTLLIARYLGAFEVARLRLSGEAPISEPDWRPDPTWCGGSAGCAPSPTAATG